ncbi:glutathione S-transferase family protein [Sphingobium sp. TKS]|uniref:glutathione S-transferase family protein n=1 Tax=Sphingobium sp. TKS TaxID=1315974 RepID=UPI0007700650|nr:glutathione S-transferase family protein [Sphingobium sp. TKS]AMK25737.1 glutathione S-transferase [Sphingobium sp. TKS]
MSITIFQLNGSRSERAVWLMEEVELPYDIRFYARLETLAAEPAYKALHPLGSSPVIEADGRRIAESGAVMEYLATTQGKGTLRANPGDPDYADYLFWFHFAESSLMPALVTEIMAERAGIAQDHPSRVAGRTHAARLLTLVDDRLSHKPYMAGDRFTAADIMMTFPFTTTRLFMSVDVEGHPNIAAYVERMAARPAYRRMRTIVDRPPTA